MKKRSEFILRKDSNDIKMLKGRKITLVLFHEPYRKNEDEMTEWMNNTWYLSVKILKITGSSEQGRCRRRCGCSWKRKEDEVNINETCQLKQWNDEKCSDHMSTGMERRSSEYKWNSGTAQKVKTPKTTGVSEWRWSPCWSGWLKRWNDVNKMGIQWSIGKKMMKEEMENSKVIMCHFGQSLWWRNKGKTQKKMVPPNLYTIHTKHVIIIPEDIQIASQYT